MVGIGNINLAEVKDTEKLFRLWQEKITLQLDFVPAFQSALCPLHRFSWMTLSIKAVQERNFDRVKNCCWCRTSIRSLYSCNQNDIVGLFPKSLSDGLRRSSRGLHWTYFLLLSVPRPYQIFSLQKCLGIRELEAATLWCPGDK